MDQSLLDALAPLVDVFEALGIEYQVGGSLVSSVHGVPRSSLDIDVLAALPAEKVSALVERIEDTYYVSKTRAASAVERESSFNVIHLATMFKVDIFIARSQKFRRSSLQRRKLELLGKEQSFFLTSAEDIVLHKLDWYRSGGGVSNQQWQDVVGVLRVQGDELDFEYLRKWARELEVRELFEAALSEASGDDT